MTDKKLRWGVLSTANIGRAAVIPAIQHSANGELCAVASRDAHKAREFAAKLNIPLPNSMHREWTIKAAEAGKHILCEKPLALSAAECSDMEDAARAHGVR